MAYEVKRTYLDLTITNAIIAAGRAIQKTHGLNVLLIAPYIPRPTGDRLADAGLNFVDRYGNLRLVLGTRYQAFVLGKPQKDRQPAKQAAGPATIQVLFTFLAAPEATSWPVRKLAEVAGVGKTLAADISRRLVEEGILEKLGTRRYRIVHQDALQERWLVGYGELLRPHLVIDTFRALQKDLDALVRSLTTRLTEGNRRWALTGGPGAYALQRFYRGERTPIFLEEVPADLQKTLRLLPDRQGPITFLRAFGPIVFWRTVGSMQVAHPWLIYAELLREGKPRALEAAERLRKEYLE